MWNDRGAAEACDCGEMKVAQERPAFALASSTQLPIVGDAATGTVLSAVMETTEFMRPLNSGRVVTEGEAAKTMLEVDARCSLAGGDAT